MARSRIYLDHAATSPLRPEAKAAMEEGFAIWANPSSPHAEGRKAKQALEDARARVKAALGWDGEVIFTSGASEAAGLARAWSRMDYQILSTVEHDAIRSPIFGAKSIYAELPVGPDGYPSLSSLGQELSEGAKHEESALVVVQHVNSETGTVQDIASLNDAVRSYQGVLLVDCAQSSGKIPLPDCDMAIVSAHKFGGPIGVGALLVRDFQLMDAPGGQERGYRRGTENLPDILGMAAALDAGGMESWATNEAERSAFVDCMDEFRVGPGEKLDTIFALAHPTMSAQAQLIRLDAMGFAVSAGSACSSGTLKKSRVLDAFGVPDDVAARTIRVSMGWSTTPEELDAFAEAWASL